MKNVTAKLTFADLSVGTPFVTADGCTWRKCRPTANRLLPNAPDNNAATVWRRNVANDAYHGHFDDDFSEFLLASAHTGECKQVTP